MTNTSTAKNDSYNVRRDIATALGYVEFGHDLHLAEGRVICTVRDRVGASLISTSNAGFRGIEGHFVSTGGHHFTASLGDVARWRIA